MESPEQDEADLPLQLAALAEKANKETLKLISVMSIVFMLTLLVIKERLPLGILILPSKAVNILIFTR